MSFYHFIGPVLSCTRAVSLATAQKMKFSIKDSCSKCDQIRRKLLLITFTEEILNGKLHFLCGEPPTAAGIENCKNNYFKDIFRQI